MSKKVRTFLGLAWMDVTSRTAYQMGKSPVLSLFALSLGATADMVGIVAAVSTITGIIFKPALGRWSDRVGRRPLLWVGAALFVLIPPLYFWVDDVPGLFVLRMIHGFASAIYGPVMAALVVDLFSQPEQSRKAFGWHDFFRSVGYVTGPLLGGLALSWWHNPSYVYLFSALIALPALLPALFLPADSPRAPEPMPLQVQDTWLPGPGARLPVALEVCARIVSRMTVVFWPLAVVDTVSPAQMGLVLSVLATGSLLCKPLYGTLANRFGVVPLVLLGSCLLGLLTPLLFLTDLLAVQILCALLLGMGESLISPATLSLVGCQAPAHARGQVMGILGAWSNTGKAAGPILCGTMVSLTGYMGAVLVCTVPLLFSAFQLARLATAFPRPAPQAVDL